MQEVFLQLEHHLAAGEFEISDLREFSAEVLVQFVEFAVSSGDDPCRGWHLVACFAFDLDHVCADVSFDM